MEGKDDRKFCSKRSFHISDSKMSVLVEQVLVLGRKGTVLQGTSHATCNLRMREKAASGSERLVTFINFYFDLFLNCECRFMY